MNTTDRRFRDILIQTALLVLIVMLTALFIVPYWPGVIGVQALVTLIVVCSFIWRAGRLFDTESIDDDSFYW